MQLRTKLIFVLCFFPNVVSAFSRDQFVVHRTKGVPTLLNSSRDETDEGLMPARLRQAKEKFNQDSKVNNLC